MTTNMEVNKKSNNFLEITPEELAEVEKKSKNTLKSSYMIDFTEKKLNKNQGFGKINAFVDGNKLNPKLASNRNEPNSAYLKKSQAILSQSKTGISTYQYDYCGLKPKKKVRTKSNV